MTPRSGYWNSHHHWCPMTLTRSASFAGGAWVRKIAATVGKAMKVRITAGMRVHASSRIALPRTCRGIAWGSRSRNRKTATSRSTCTTRKMAVSQRRIWRKIRWEVQPKSERGVSVVAGDSSRPQPASAKPTAITPSPKTRVSRARRKDGPDSM